MFNTVCLVIIIYAFINKPYFKWMETYFTDRKDLEETNTYYYHDTKQSLGRFPTSLYNSIKTVKITKKDSITEDKYKNIIIKEILKEREFTKLSTSHSTITLFNIFNLSSTSVKIFSIITKKTFSFWDYSFYTIYIFLYYIDVNYSIEKIILQVRKELHNALLATYLSLKCLIVNFFQYIKNILNIKLNALKDGKDISIWDLFTKRCFYVFTIIFNVITRFNITINLLIKLFKFIRHNFPPKYKEAMKLLITGYLGLILSVVRVFVSKSVQTIIKKISTKLPKLNKNFNLISNTPLNIFCKKIKYNMSLILIQIPIFYNKLIVYSIKLKDISNVVFESSYVFYKYIHSSWTNLKENDYIKETIRYTYFVGIKDSTDLISYFSGSRKIESSDSLFKTILNSFKQIYELVVKNLIAILEGTLSINRLFNNTILKFNSFIKKLLQMLCEYFLNFRIVKYLLTFDDNIWFLDCLKHYYFRLSSFFNSLGNQTKFFIKTVVIFVILIRFVMTPYMYLTGPTWDIVLTRTYYNLWWEDACLYYDDFLRSGHRIYCFFDLWDCKDKERRYTTNTLAFSLFSTYPSFFDDAGIYYNNSMEECSYYSNKNVWVSSPVDLVSLPCYISATNDFTFSYGFSAEGLFRNIPERFFGFFFFAWPWSVSIFTPIEAVSNFKSTSFISAFAPHHKLGLYLYESWLFVSHMAFNLFNLIFIQILDNLVNVSTLPCKILSLILEGSVYAIVYWPILIFNYLVNTSLFIFNFFISFLEIFTTYLSSLLNVFYTNIYAIKLLPLIFVFIAVALSIINLYNLKSIIFNSLYTRDISKSSYYDNRNAYINSSDLSMKWVYLFNC